MAIDTDQQTILRLMDRANREGRRLGELSGDDLRTPVLVIQDGLGRESLVVIHVPGVQPEAARVTLAAFRAEAAAICFEGWEVDLPASPEMRAEWERTGEPPPIPEGFITTAPSKHPERFETLTVIGQVKGQPVTHWSWKIVREQGQPRRFEWRDLSEMIDMPSRFNPLFGTDEEVRELVRTHRELERLRNDVRNRRS